MLTKYLRNFWRSLETHLINCRVELKLNLTKYCVLSAAGNDNTNDNPDNFIFTIKDTKSCVLVITLSVKDNQKLSKLLNKGFQRSVCWNEYKTKSDNKSTTHEYRYFLELGFVGVNRLFVFVFVLVFKTQRYYLPKGIIINHNVIINGKNFYDQPNNSGIKRYREIRKLTAGQGEDYTTGYLLDYDYIKNHYRLKPVDLSRQKELDADPKAIQQIEFVIQLKKLNGYDNNESVFILTVLKKVKETRLKFSLGSINSIIKGGKLSGSES